MSFSQQVKEDLVKHISTSRHCQLAEIAALHHFLKVKGTQESTSDLSINIDNEAINRKYFTLLKKTFNINEDCTKVSETAKIALNSDILLQLSCCKRAYLRGAFLAIGTVSDPEKSYQLEYVCQSMEDADNISMLLKNFEIEGHVFQRKSTYVVYIKDGSQIAETLNVLEAHVALMEFENMRILKEMRNSVNRKVNCETANINKTVLAAQKQIDEINLLMSSQAYKGLPDTLKEIAKLRIEYPDASLAELGELCNPTVGKSGVNHRLRKLGELALKVKGGEL